MNVKALFELNQEWPARETEAVISDISLKEFCCYREQTLEHPLDGRFICLFFRMGDIIWVWSKRKEKVYIVGES